MTERSLAPLLALIFALSLSACDLTPPLSPTAGLDVQKVLRVDHQQIEYEAGFPPGSAVLTPSEAARLDDFLASAAVRQNEQVYLAPAANDPLAAARVGRIVDALARRNLGAERVAPPPGGVPPNRLLILVKHYVVQPPACPDWSADPDSDHDNMPASNFGCANMVNLGLMIDNPRDLVIGRKLGPVPAEPGLNAMERYRTDQVKALPANTTGSPGGGSGGSSSGSGGGGSAGGGGGGASSSGGQ